MKNRNTKKLGQECLEGEISPRESETAESWRNVLPTLLSHGHDRLQHLKIVMEETKSGNNIIIMIHWS